MMNASLFQTEFRWASTPEPLDPSFEPGDFVEVDGRRVPLVYQRHPRAKRYRLFVDGAGRPRVTLPRRGSVREARRFVAANESWLAGQIRRHAGRRVEREWGPDTEILWRGAYWRLGWVQEGEADTAWISLGEERIPAGPDLRLAPVDWRPTVEQYLRQLAARELPGRVLELAALHQCAVRKVSVRNQRSRWGSCSRRGTISLNWRLVQTPHAVRDYIILHELMHLREMNHSPRYWAHVAAVCPDYEQCERWLRNHPELMG